MRLVIDRSTGRNILRRVKHSPAHCDRGIHATLRLLLLGTNTESSPLYTLAGHTDVLRLIFEHVKVAWRREIMAATLNADPLPLAFAHVDNVHFPEPQGRNINMMPFVMGDKLSLPEELRCYWGMINICVKTLFESKHAPPPTKRVGYLTVHESVVVNEGSSQRRPGLHTEGFTRAPFDSGGVRELPQWHHWGFGRAMNNGEFEGGIFMASTVNDSCQLYHAIVPEELVGKGGDVEHLREVLDEHFPEPARARLRLPDDPERFGQHAATCYCDMHLQAGEDNADGILRAFQGSVVRGPVSLQAGELVWMTDRTPHESMPLQVGQQRQFFRLVTGGVDTWYAAHSTPNPLGVQPQAKVVDYDKFVGPNAATDASAPSHGKTSSRRKATFLMRRLASALIETRQSAAD